MNWLLAYLVVGEIVVLDAICDRGFGADSKTLAEEQSRMGWSDRQIYAIATLGTCVAVLIWPLLGLGWIRK